MQTKKTLNLLTKVIDHDEISRMCSTSLDQKQDIMEKIESKKTKNITIVKEDI